VKVLLVKYIRDRSQQGTSCAQPEHITHASLFSSEHASFASSNSRAFLRNSAAANSGSFSAARRCASSSPAKLSSRESAGVSGYDGVEGDEPLDAVVAVGVEAVATVSAAVSATLGDAAAGFIETSDCCGD